MYNITFFTMHCITVKNQMFYNFKNACGARVNFYSHRVTQSSQKVGRPRGRPSRLQRRD